MTLAMVLFAIVLSLLAVMMAFGDELVYIGAAVGTFVIFIRSLKFEWKKDSTDDKSTK